MVKGVEESVVGYTGGIDPDPTYETVSSGNSHHAEVVRVTFDESLITLDDILRIFWTIHDPTTLNRQGHDVGSQYRSCIFTENPRDDEIVQRSIAEIQDAWTDPVVTTVEKLETFYPAEEYHQDYFSKNPEAGYCQVVINPKLHKLREKAAKLLTAN
jgi:peptide-methionine (S)-S-oxide reductase